jgi:hypothetical protein
MPPSCNNNQQTLFGTKFQKRNIENTSDTKTGTPNYQSVQGDSQLSSDKTNYYGYLDEQIDHNAISGIFQK